MRSEAWIAALGLALVAAPAIGAPDKDAGQTKELPVFKKADDNGDGQLTFKEVKDLGIAKKAFKQEDLDNDGKLSKYDYKYGIK
jgi:Ca2+-binding EF-hand superfamily protein